MTDAEKPKLEIDWLKTFAGALAATSSAVLLSTLGAAGTLIGAALGSVVVTVTSALYAQGLARSRARLSHTQEVALARAGVPSSEVRRAQADLDPAIEDLTASAEGPTARERLAQLPWRRIAIGAGAMFLVAVVAISVFEVVAGRSVSSYTGGTSSKEGTSLTHLTGSHTERGDEGDDGSDGGSDDGRGGRDDEAPAPGDDPSTGEPTGEPTEDVTDEPTTGTSPDSTADPSSDPSQSAEPGAPTPTVPVPSAPGASPLG